MLPPPCLVVCTGPPGTGKSTLAAVAADVLGAPVLGWDWAMAALTGFPRVQAALEALQGDEHRAVGWSILWSLTTAQLREERSVVLDGVARTPEVERARDLAAEHGARCVVVVTRCADRAVHRRRIEGRQRRIPGWHELTWESVLGSLGRWTEPADVDLTLDATGPLEGNVAMLRRLLGEPAEDTHEAR